ncbi:hypothetical protein V8C34DRAFT_272788 [Trichoderma compactum]
MDEAVAENNSSQFQMVPYSFMSLLSGSSSSVALNDYRAIAIGSRPSYILGSTSPKHDIPACQSVPGWDGMLQSYLYVRVLCSLLHSDMLPTSTLHVHGCSAVQCSAVQCSAVQYTRMYMQRRASVEFCWASPRAMPCHSAPPAPPIGISRYPFTRC